MSRSLKKLLFGKRYARGGLVPGHEVILLEPGELVINPGSWLGRFFITAYDLGVVADEMAWDWPPRPAREGP